MIEHHDLDHEFPQFSERAHALAELDPDFAALVKEYNDLDAEINTLEENNVPTDDKNFEELKLRRLNLKDRLYDLLREQG